MREMKDSGVEWIGKMPSTWNLCRIKDVCNVDRGGSPRPIDDYLTDDPDGYNWIKIGDTIKGSKFIDSTSQRIIESGLNKTRLVKSGTLLLTNSMSFGEPYILNINGCIHDGWLAFSNYRGVLKEYLYYYLISDLCSIQFKLQVVGGVVQNLNIDKVKVTYLFVPPIHEQKKIVIYLEDRCAKIDSIIMKQLAIIEKLKEYKLSIIAEGVTKGIDCKAEFKDSGIEWIGKIPKHWTVTKMKQVALFFNGDRSSKYPSGEDFVDEGVFFITSNNLGEIVLDTSIETNKYITHSKYQELGGAKIRMNDIIFCLRGSVGKCAINKSITEGTIASSLVDIRTTGINPDFLNMVLHTKGVTEVASVKAIGIGSLNLAAKDISEVVIPLPPAKEAEEIAERLSNKTAEIDKKISIHEKLINQLNDFKRSLIYEMVSGKKQVL